MLGSRVVERLSAIFLFILIHSSAVTIVHSHLASGLYEQN